MSTATLDTALSSAAKRLRATPQIDQRARATLLATVTSSYDHRPAAMRDLTRDEHRAALGDDALVVMYTHSVLSLRGQYARAAAHLLHALNDPTPAWPSPPGRKDPSAMTTARGSSRNLGLFHNEPGLADTMSGLDTQVTEAAEYLNSLDYDRATATTLAIAARLTASGGCTKTFATRIARHLVETDAQRLSVD
ncbi:hypothetical protein [Kitasatospora cineracea]|uniref:hypothetical protein n=1 Tax=Kitasatospora cineracea TaxID=88074 RepID=UPI0036BFE0BB